MDTTAGMTELEAVNIILKNDGEQPINALPAPDFAPAGLAQAQLRQTSREVQMDGWAYNVDLETKLTPDVNNEIVLPLNVLWVRPAGWTKHRRIVERAGKLYDLAENTHEFTGEVYVDMCLFLDWPDLPAYAHGYIAIKAARDYQQDFTGDDGTDRFTAKDERRAFAAMKRADRRVRRRNMLERHYRFHRRTP